ncbi:MAG: DpnD/PcfM family protein [Sulfurovaceae bacterium]|nr:DpnD/PcfM family protein [Sulfurovaceae bacterium]
MQYDIEISEKLSRVLHIDASSLEEAIEIAEQKYNSEEIVLDWTDFYDNVAIREFDQNIQNEKDELVGEIIEYLIKDEERHFLESGKPDNHIYTKLIKLQNFL